MNNFAPLVKIAKNKMEQIQRELFNAMARLGARQDEIASLKRELLDLIPPESGVMSQLIVIKNSQQILRNEIADCENDVEQIKNLISGLRNLLKSAQIELEKVEFLSNDYEAKKASKRQKLEQLLLEEAGVNSYIYRNGDRA